MTNQDQIKVAKIVNILKNVTGQIFEINILNENKFTFFFEGKNEDAVEKFRKYFNGNLDITGGYDQDGYTCLLGVKK